ncbi:MAG: hypothetical protein ACPG5O_12745 [Pseudoalteromonas tetraodonis]
MTIIEKLNLAIETENTTILSVTLINFSFKNNLIHYVEDFGIDLTAHGKTILAATLESKKNVNGNR